MIIITVWEGGKSYFKIVLSKHVKKTFGQNVLGKIFLTALTPRKLNPKWTSGGPKNGQWGLERGQGKERLLDPLTNFR